jgi:hypothetical protein
MRADSSLRNVAISSQMVRYGQAVPTRSAFAYFFRSGKDETMSGLRASLIAARHLLGTVMVQQGQCDHRGRIEDTENGEGK